MFLSIFKLFRTVKNYQNKIIGIPNLYRDLMVHFGSKETLCRVLCKYVDEETAASAVDAIGASDKGCTVIDQQNGVFFMWMPRKPQSAEDFGFLVHGLLHAVAETMRVIGVDFSEDSEEVYAYTIGWLTHQIMERFGITISSCRAQQL